MNTNKEWKKEIRDWWYKYQDAGYELPESGRVELEKILKEAVEEREKEIVEKMSGLLKDEECHESFLDGFQSGCPNEHYDQAIIDVLTLIQSKSI